MGDNPAHIPLDLAAISRRLTTCMPAAAGLTEKSFANIKSDFLAAVKASGIESVPSGREDPDDRQLEQIDGGAFVEADAPRLVALSALVQRQRDRAEQVSDAVLTDFIELGQAGDAASKAQRTAPKRAHHLERSRPKIPIAPSASVGPVLPRPS